MMGEGWWGDGDDRCGLSGDEVMVWEGVDVMGEGVWVWLTRRGCKGVIGEGREGDEWWMSGWWVVVVVDQVSGWWVWGWGWWVMSEWVMGEGWGVGMMGMGVVGDGWGVVGGGCGWSGEWVLGIGSGGWGDAYVWVRVHAGLDIQTLRCDVCIVNVATHISLFHRLTITRSRYTSYPYLLGYGFGLFLKISRL